MENENNQHFSITAYHIVLKQRQKFYGDNDKETATDKTNYLANTGIFVKEFVDSIRSIKSNEEFSYLYVSNIIDLSGPEMAGQELVVNYGKSGQDFKTIEYDGTEKDYDKRTKIVKFYRVFFFNRGDGNCFMVVFRNGSNSCKTAVFNKMKEFLANTNVIVDLPYVSNNEYIEQLCEKMDFVNLTYTTLYKTYPNDNADDPKTLTKKYSVTTIDLSFETPRNKFLALLRGLFVGKDSNKKKELTSKLEVEVNKDDYVLDTESLSVLVNINGVKRTVPIQTIMSFYDVDISSKLDFDQNGNPTEQSIAREVIDYTKGIRLGEDTDE